MIPAIWIRTAVYLAPVTLALPCSWLFPVRDWLSLETPGCQGPGAAHRRDFVLSSAYPFLISQRSFSVHPSGWEIDSEGFPSSLFNQRSPRTNSVCSLHVASTLADTRTQHTLRNLLHIPHPSPPGPPYPANQMWEH
ncbi:hypothetical protein ANANG_G00206450 [Anguilla anguilla]|uniref:Uncharacterized protein n=1 Tax=Anguilla anguilla TaxID=7936 RepID=A0A9D3RQK9_ANGAN|nr:hypothetical protein ANANG_G00206450 [Anguilla anguilla]